MKEHGWWMVGGVLLAFAFGVMANKFGGKQPEVVYVEADGTPVSSPEGPPQVMPSKSAPRVKYVQISEGAAKVVRILNDDSRDWKGYGDLRLVNAAGEETFSAFRCSFKTVHNFDLRVLVGVGKDRQIVETLFSETDMQAVYQAFETRVKKVQAVQDAKRDADRRKALEGLK
jgi:hypothetical protein